MDLVDRIVVGQDRIEVLKKRTDEDECATLVVPVKFGSRNRAQILDDGKARQDPTIVRALARAHDWRGWIEKGNCHSYRDVAGKAGVSSNYVQLMLPLAFLDPQITRELLDGRRQVRGGLIELLRRGIPVDWERQRLLFQS